MDNTHDYIHRITTLANRNKELSSQLHKLVNRYSIVQKQNEKYNSLLSQFSDTGETSSRDLMPAKSKKKVEHLRTVSLLHVSIRGFEQLHKMTDKSGLIDTLDEIYISIGKIAEEYKLEKIKGFGDNIIYATGLTSEYRTNPINITLAASTIQAEVNNIVSQIKSPHPWTVKIGIHTGPVLSTDAGKQQKPYSLSGDNINVTSRLSAACPAGKINMSEMTYELVKEFFDISHHGAMPVKYKGEMNMFLVNGLKEELHLKDLPFQPNKVFDVRYGQIRFEDIQETILDLLEKNLPSNLYYHNVKHTVDVATEVELIGWAENLPEEDILILKIAALFHDAGHITDYRHHEHEGTKMARKILPRYNITDQDIETICRLIMSTKLPPQPKDKLEQVMCDSDLDYLGRTDFIPVSNTLYRELKERKLVGSWNEWNQIQLNFISKHQYFTKTAQKLREVNKQQQIGRIEQLLIEENIDVNIEK